MLRALHTARHWLFLILTILVVTGAAWAAPAVIIVTGEQADAHRETIGALRSGLAGHVEDGNIAVVRSADAARAAFDGARIVVTVGSEAARRVAEASIKLPVLHTLLTRESFESLAAGAPTGRHSAIYLDQPVRRQVALLTEALPDRGRVAILAGPRSQDLARRLSAAAREVPMHVATEVAASDRDIYPALQRLLSENTVLLAVPDSNIYNAYTIQNILLTSYRSRAPLVGFSSAYVRAGALLALYSTPAQIGDQAADVVRHVLAGGVLPAPQPPNRFEIGINPNVARSLGITLRPADELVARVQRREAAP